jgi:hypothetical protein
MNVGNGTVAAQFLSLGIFVSNFRYCVFAVWHTHWLLTASPLPPTQSEAGKNNFYATVEDITHFTKQG